MRKKEDHLTWGSSEKGTLLIASSHLFLSVHGVFGQYLYVKNEGVLIISCTHILYTSAYSALVEERKALFLHFTSQRILLGTEQSTEAEYGKIKRKHKNIKEAQCF